MRISCLAAMLALLSISSHAQNSQFKKGQIDVNAGVGFVTPLFDISGFGIKTKVPPISIAADYAINDEVSAGIILATAQDNVYTDLYDLNTGEQYYGRLSTLKHVIVGGRVLYHFSLAEKLDTYGGGMLGYNIVTEKIDPNVQVMDQSKIKVKGFTYTLLLGARYHFTPHAGLFLELGYGVTVINLGLNIKL